MDTIKALGAAVLFSMLFLVGLIFWALPYTIAIVMAVLLLRACS